MAHIDAGKVRGCLRRTTWHAHVITRNHLAARWSRVADADWFLFPCPMVRGGSHVERLMR